MKMKEELRRHVLSLSKDDKEWVYPILDEIVEDGIKVIEKNLELGNIKEVNDKVYNLVAFKMIERYWGY